MASLRKGKPNSREKPNRQYKERTSWAATRQTVLARSPGLVPPAQVGADRRGQPVDLGSRNGAYCKAGPAARTAETD